jgi:DNA-binding MarR family transcriptional regulator
MPDQALRTNFDTSVTFLIASLANKLSNAASRRWRRRFHIGLMEWRVLALLAVEAKATPGRVAQVAGVDKSVVSRAVGRLERRGLIRVLGEAQPGRQTRLELTAGGQALHDEGIVLSFAAEAELLHEIPDQDRDALVALLKRLGANVPRVERV